MTIKALLLDLDGTLYAKKIEPLVDYANEKRFYDYVKKEKLFSRIPKDDIAETYMLMVQKSPSHAIMRLCKKHHLNFTRFLDYVGDVDPRDFGIRSDKEIVSSMRELSKKYLLIIISNSDHVWVNRATDAIGLKKIVPISRRFSATSTKGHLKPDPQSYQTVMKRFKLRGNEILFLDDRQSNLVGAKRLGIRTVRIMNDGRHNRKSIYNVLKMIKQGKYDRG